jgi:hypothetical protein
LPFKNLRIFQEVDNEYLIPIQDFLLNDWISRIYRNTLGRECLVIACSQLVLSDRIITRADFIIEGNLRYSRIISQFPKYILI